MLAALASGRLGRGQRQPASQACSCSSKLLHHSHVLPPAPGDLTLHLPGAIGALQCIGAAAGQRWVDHARGATLPEHAQVRAPRRVRRVERRPTRISRGKDATTTRSSSLPAPCPSTWQAAVPAPLGGVPCPLSASRVAAGGGAAAAIVGCQGLQSRLPQRPDDVKLGL